MCCYSCVVIALKNEYDLWKVRVPGLDRSTTNFNQHPPCYDPVQEVPENDQVEH